MAAFAASYATSPAATQALRGAAQVHVPSQTQGSQHAAAGMGQAAVGVVALSAAAVTRLWI